MTGVLRVWEAQRPVVVIGFSNRIDREVNIGACDRLGIPVLRRCSGGGAVLLAPGSLNYALVLPLGAAPALATVDGTNAYVLERHRSAFARIVGDGVRVPCCTDLALGDRKFSGNAQRRRRRAVLFHGTFLLNMDLSLIEACLPMPSRQPSYRGGRAHRDFLVNLGIRASEAKAALIEVWDARGDVQEILRHRIVMGTRRVDRPAMTHVGAHSDASGVRTDRNRSLPSDSGMPWEGTGVAPVPVRH